MTHSPTSDPDKVHAIVLAIVFTVTLPGLMAATLALRPAPPVDLYAGAAEALGVTTSDLHRGEAIYRRTCTACHGADAAGVARLGKPLKNSAFVQSHTDRELVALIVEGRLPTDPENTTGVAMPPRGAQALADDQIEDVVHYLRTLQDSDAPTASLEPWMRPVVPAEPPSAPRDLVAAPITDAPPATGSDAARTASTDPTPTAPAAEPSVAAGDLIADASVAAGGSTSSIPSPSAPDGARATFVAACSSCHGPDGAGIANLGKPLNTSEFVRSKTDEELITFIKTGRPIWDAENTTGLDMPPKGGNPALTDEDINEIVSFIRYLQGES